MDALTVLVGQIVSAASHVELVHAGEARHDLFGGDTVTVLAGLYEEVPGSD